MKFTKVSYDQFAKDYLKIFYGDDAQLPIGIDGYLKEVYEEIKLPKRGSAYSAGYDLCTPISFRLEPGETILIPSGIRAEIGTDKVLLIAPRSSTGMKGLFVRNTLGVIDSDYFYAKNEGHIMYGLKNIGDYPLTFGEGDRILQGIIVQYFVMDDDDTTEVREGGIGSTGQR